MKRIIGKRGTGKTNDLIEYAAKNNLIIFSGNPQNVIVRSNVLGYTQVKSYSWSYLMHNPNVFEHSKYVIDDLEGFARYCAPGYIDGYTLSDE